MEIATFTPSAVASWALPMEEIRLMPISDIQFGSQDCDADRLKRHVDWGLEHDCHFVGLGDYCDRMSPSNRAAIRAARIYDSVSAAIQEKAEEDLAGLLKILAPTAGKWLGLVSGHHFHDFEDGTTTDTRLASALKTRYMGDGVALSLLKLTHTIGKYKYHGYAKVWFTHGTGAGQKAAAPLNKLENVLTTFYADVYLMGHHHKKAATKIPFLTANIATKSGEIRWEARNRVLASTGGFLKGYVAGRRDHRGIPSGSYVEKGMMNPTALGGVIVYIRPRFTRGEVLVDVDVSL